jgi:hypothetical protein
MRAFASEAELRTFLERVSGERSRSAVEDAVIAPVPAPSPPLPASAAPEAAGSIVVTGQREQRANQESPSAISSVDGEGAPNITNNQTANVDEGGIVKTHGTHLVILRRGRLFTVDTGGPSGTGLRTIDTVDAFPPGDNGGRGAWYDEMLVSGDMVVVIGFNYARTGTEINRFHISRDGQLTYRDTHHLRSDDYYSSRNYASRLIGTRLVVYTPLSFYNGSGSEIFDSLPALRRWSSGGPRAGFERLVTPRRVFVADMVRNSRTANIDTTHSVTSCDLAAERLDCNSTAILGSGSRNFYVAEDAVYVWTGEVFRQDDEDDFRSMLYRIPLDGTAPQAVGVWGNPTDQFSFRADAGALNVLVRNDVGGERMWSAEAGQGSLALLRLPYRAFGSGRAMALARHYQPLPGGNDITGLQNRYVGDHLLYGGNGGNQRRLGTVTKPVDWGDNGPRIYAVGLADRQVTTIRSDIAITRIDQMGRDGMVIGTNPTNGLVFQTIDLSGTPHAADSYVLPGAREGENRSHAYFFRSDNPEGTNGLLGLPVASAITNPNRRFLGSGSGIFFLERAARRLSPAGQLDADTGIAVQDRCLASCVDWYGNARPIFYGQRIFALMGYELVEGRLAQGHVGEVRRLNFAPGARTARR